jgi:DNA-binding CsgD family transcriptional regulator
VILTGRAVSSISQARHRLRGYCVSESLRGGCYVHESPKKHVMLGRLIHAFIRAGWNPPTPSSRVAQHLLDDLAEVGAGEGGGSGNGSHRSSCAALTPRERTALTLTAIGMTGPKAAEAMDVSHETIRSHLKQARHRLGASTVAHAVAIALRDEIIEPPHDAPTKNLAA